MGERGIHALFFVDTGPSAGLGHIRRSITLAKALSRAGAECRFVGDPDAVASQAIEAAGFHFSGDHRWKNTTGSLALDGKKPVVIVVDSYHVTDEWLNHVRQSAKALIYIDDFDRIPDAADVIIQIRPEEGRRRRRLSSARSGQQVFRGARYALPDVSFFRGTRRRVRPRARRFLLTLGGADPHGLHSRLMPALLSVLDQRSELTVVVGPYFNQSQITADPRVRWVHDVSPDKMAELMFHADLAITAGGQSLYELAATGLPAVAVQVADNQRANIAGFAQMGTIVFAGSAEQEDLVRRVVSEVDRLGKDAVARETMSRRGQQLVNGEGLPEIVEAIMDGFRGDV